MFCRDCLHFPINWHLFQEKLIWLFQTSMHPAFTCAVPCLRSAGGIWPACLVGFDQLEQRAGAVACSLESCCSAPEPPATCFRFCCSCVFFFFFFFPQIGVFLAAPTAIPLHRPLAHQERHYTMGVALQSLFNNCRMRNTGANK